MNRAVRYRIRIFFTILSFLGGIFVVFWAQGFRFDFSEKKIIQTGVLQVSSFPSSAVFVDGKFMSKTPETFLGLPINNSQVCFLTFGFQKFCYEITIGSQLIVNFKNILLIPKNLFPQLWAHKNSVFFEQNSFGAIRILKNFSAIEIISPYEHEIFDFPKKIVGGFLNKNGKLFLLFSANKKNNFEDDIFFQNVFSDREKDFFPKLRFSNNGFLFFQNKDLFFRHNGQSKKIFQFNKPIENAFFYPDSDSIFVVLPQKIFLSPKMGADFVFFADKSPQGKFFLSSSFNQNQIFWQNNDLIFSYKW